MPVVDFEQDPDAPFGSGNFRDERGHITYLHDPETASTFVKTLAKTSTDIASKAMGGAAPQPGPDMRLALNDTGAPVPAGDMSIAPPPMPNTAPPTASDTANMSITPAETTALGGSPERLVGAVSAATSPPTPPTAAPAKSRPQQLVDAASKATSARLPLTATSSTTNRSVVKGADRGMVEQRIANEEKAFSAVDAERQRLAEAKDARVDQGYDRMIKGTKAAGAEEMGVIAENRAKEAEAARLEKLKREELAKNDKQLDPERVVRNMSGGKKVGMTILAALNGAFGALIGKKNNDVIDIIDQEIDRDIQKQRDEIASGRIRIGNEIDKYVKMGFDAQTAEKMAWDRKKAATMAVIDLEAKRLGVQGENAENARFLTQESQAQRMVRQGDLLATTEDKEQVTQSDTVQRELPKPADGSAGFEGFMKQLQIRKLMREEGLTLDEKGNIVGTGEPRPDEIANADKQLEAYDTATGGLAQAQVAMQELLKNANFHRDERGQLVPPEDIVAKGMFDAPAEAINDMLGNDTDGTKLKKSITLLKEAFGRMQSQGAISASELDNFSKYIDASLEGGFIENVTQIDNMINGVAEKHMRRLSPLALAELARRENRALPKPGAVKPVTGLIPLPEANQSIASQ